MPTTATTTFYVFDATDPIIAAYRGIFPRLFKDAARCRRTSAGMYAIPNCSEDAGRRVRPVPHDDPAVFYNREDLWTVASEVGMEQPGEQPRR